MSSTEHPDDQDILRRLSERGVVPAHGGSWLVGRSFDRLAAFYDGSSLHDDALPGWLAPIVATIGFMLACLAPLALAFAVVALVDLL